MNTFERIPDELREQAFWINWRWGDVDPATGKRKKPPYCATDLRRHGSSTNPETWATFEQAVAVVEAGRADGIGFALRPPWVGVDLDEELPEAERFAIARMLDSYTEESVSGTGLHVIVRASLNGGRHPEGFGVFQEGRLWYCSGKHVPGTPWEIHERQLELDAVLRERLPKPVETTSIGVVSRQLVDVDDQKLVDFIQDKYPDLWAGRWDSQYGSQSEADLALCSRLAWRTGNDAARIDRLFRSSGLYRDKWERDDYRAETIKTAIDGAASEGSANVSERSRGSDSVDSDSGVLGAAGANGVAESALKDSATPDAAAPVEAEERGTASESDSDADSVDSDRPFALPIGKFIELEREHREPMLADSLGNAVVGFLSLVLLGALGGHGKTTWTINLLLHMAAGIDFAPFVVPRPVSILVIENEGPEQLFADKLKARLAHFPHELKARLDVCTFDWGGFSLADDRHRERLTQEIADKDYDLVFGDPLDSLGIEGVGSPEDTRKFLALMKETGLNKSVAWWLNTHPRKEETKEALNEIAGAWGGKPDTVFLLRMLEGDRTQVRQPKLRWARRGKGPTLLYAFDPDTEAFTFIGEQSEDERDYLTEIRELLADGVWRTVKEIAVSVEAGGIGANDKIVKKILGEHPDLVESRTGDEAKALGRKPQATL